jgi:histidinol-phosphate/aromatic aminotransferase/cobyric acid decarboxylase-like protein
MGCKLTPRLTNFISFDVQRDAREVARIARGRRAGSAMDRLGRSLRSVTIGTQEQNQRFLDAFAKATRWSV